MFVPGMQAFGANMAMNAALGSGIGTLLAGGDVKDAVKNAAIAGALQGVTGMGTQGSATGKAVELGASGTQMGEGIVKGYGQMGAGATTTAGAQAAGTAAAKSGIMSNLAGNVGLAALVGGLAAEEPDMPELTEEQKRMMETGERRPDYKGRNIVLEYDYPVYAAQGGFIQGPGTGTSDSIKSGIYQNGQKVQEARLSDGELVFTECSVSGLGNGDRAKGAAKMYEMMRHYERRA